MVAITEFLFPKSFNRYSWFLVAFSFVTGLALFGVVLETETNKQRFGFSCRKKGQDKELFQKRCFDDYLAKTTRGFPLYGFVLLYFLSVTLVSLLYSLSVKTRIEEIERQDQPARQENQSCRLYCRYCIQLAIRITIGIVFLILQWGVLYPLQFPSKYACDLTNIHQAKVVNATSSPGNTTGYWYDCYNPQAGTKTFWTILVFTVIILLTFCILVELMYVVRKAKVNNCFTKDLEFVQIYLLNKSRVVGNYVAQVKANIRKTTKYYEALLPDIPGEERKLLELDTIYTNLIMYPGRAEYEFTGERHEINEGYLKSQEQHKSINKLEEIFAPEPGNPQERPLSILIIGRPGIGKSLLCLKTLRDWACEKMFNEETETGKRFEFVCLFRFRHFNSDEKMNLQYLLGREQSVSGAFPQELYEWIVSHPKQVLFIFDGLDEFGMKENISKEEEFGNGLEEKIPFSVLFAKLAFGKLLAGATVVTTSRPTALSSVSFAQQRFDKSLEILGFSYEERKAYVERYFGDLEMRERVWNHISSNGNLLSLCYIPVTCHILCFTFQERLKQGDGNVECLPTTLTEIYEDALVIILCKHNPEYRCNVPEQQKLLSSFVFAPKVEESLIRLGKVAYKGIENDRLVFESREVKGHEESGLLHRLPNEKVGPIQRKEQYCFLHLTIQEFLAAKYIVAQIKKGHSEFETWIAGHLDQGKWEVVMQFVAGLLPGEDGSTTKIFIDSLPHPTTDQWWPIEKKLALRLFKCIFEISRNSNSGLKQLIRDKLSGVVNVSLGYAALTDADLTSMAFVLQEAKNMTSLNVRNNHITSIGCLEIRKLLKILGSSQSHLSNALATNECKLTSLIICLNKIEDNGVKHLSNALATAECQLTTLDVSGNNIGDDGLQHLSRALTKKECKLTKLAISSNKICEEGMNGMDLLSKALSTHECNLTRLDVSCNNIGDDGLRLLSRALSTNECKITGLNICGNNITDDGVKYLSDALSTNESKIVELFISENKIGDDGFKYVADALVTNQCKLTVLNTKGNIIGENGLKHLSNALSKCKLTSLEFSSDNIGYDGLAHLSDAIASHGCKLTTLNITTSSNSTNGKYLAPLSAREVMGFKDKGDGRLKPLSDLLARTESKEHEPFIYYFLEHLPELITKQQFPPDVNQEAKV